MPSFLNTLTGKMREAKARRKMSLNSTSKPPMPIFSNEKSDLKMFVLAAVDPSACSSNEDKMADKLAAKMTLMHRKACGQGGTSWGVVCKWGGH